MAQRTPPRQQASRARQGRRLNRSEQQAMEIRRTSTLTTAAMPDVLTPEATPKMAGTAPSVSSATPVSSVRSRRRRDNRPVVRAVTLTRDQEYSFIRTDLRRLVLLSAVLVVIMIVVLFVVEALV